MYKKSKYGVLILILLIFLLVYDFYLNIQIIPDVWNSEWFRWRVALLIIMLIGSVIYFWVKRIQNARIRQQEFTGRIIKTHEDEWKQIAAELHDGIGQNLTFINNRILQLANSSYGEGNKEHLMEISKSLIVSVDEVRNIMNRLYPHHIERLGFKKAVDALISRAKSSSGLIINYDIEDIGNQISAETRINLYRILQEALNNIVKHSGATHAVFDLYSDSKYIYLIIEDNGKGFDLYDERHEIERGYGMEFMKERIRTLGGKFTITSKPGTGTRINITIRKKK